MKQIQPKAWSRRFSSAALATGLFVSIFAGSSLALPQDATQNVAGANQPSQNQLTQNQGVPRFVRFNGVVKDADGRVPSGDVTLTFNLYEQQDGGSPLWSETQTVQPAKDGRYTVLLGATQQDGLPRELFTTNQARWIAVQPGLAGVSEQPRALLVGAPYAIKAGDAETLGGLPASAYMLANSQAIAGKTQSSVQNSTSHSNTSSSATISGTGTTNFVPLWTNSTTLSNSVLFQSGSGTSVKVGIGTTSPAATLDVKGGSTVRGMLNLPATGTATAATGKNSQPLDLAASAFNSGTNTAANEMFQWMAEPAGNDTTSPSATLNLLFGSSGTTATETGLSVASNGQISFASGQTFPTSGIVLPLTLNAGSASGVITASNTELDGLVGNSAQGDGVNGNSSIGNKSGVYGSNSNSGGFGVFGRNTASGSTGYLGGNTIGISGVSTSPAAGTAGVYGVSQTPSGEGMVDAAGVWGDSLAGDGMVASSSQNNGIVAFTADSLGQGNAAAFLDNKTQGGIVMQTFGEVEMGSCTISTDGDLTCTGSKSAAVPVDNGSRMVKLYAIESPQNWFEDFGSSQLSNGSATIQLEGTFGQTVNTNVNYHVYLTPNGDCKGLYVTQKTASSFEVHELGKGTSNIAFDYRIVAERKGYENIRLADRTRMFDRNRLTAVVKHLRKQAVK